MPRSQGYIVNVMTSIDIGRVYYFGSDIVGISPSGTCQWPVQIKQAEGKLTPISNCAGGTASKSGSTTAEQVYMKYVPPMPTQ